ncbi:MAG: signal recognition particle protein [Hyphomicrobiales bacterium]|nr:signal recognition particle protein [Hyphomicrobiales bacterium]
MFQSLSDRLSGVLDKLTRRGALTDEDVNEAMREVRRALLEADVALEVVRSFTDRVRTKAVGREVVKSVTPGQMVVKIVHDELIATLGSDAQPIDLAAQPPVPILMVGLQGSGKTTTTAKIAYRLTNRDRKKVLMASLDTRRPAAMEQLRILGEQAGVSVLPIVAGQTPLQIARRALDAARLQAFDVVMLDTAGRTTVDEELMAEVAEVKAATNPHEVLLVADALTGQDAVNTAKAFDGRLGVTGIVLTRVDGDGRGGAALSMRAVTGKPIKLIGVGEKWDALEDFDPKRIAGRILGMGDIVGLVEKAAQTIDADKARAIAEKMRKGMFDLEDMSEQLQQVEKLGGMSSLMGMLPGVGKIKKQIDGANLDGSIIKRQRAIISSMTPNERRNPKILDGKRKRRIASGSGTKPEDVNRLLKMHRDMADMMKMMRKNPGMMGRMAGAMGFGGAPGGGAGPSAAELEAMQKELAGLSPDAIAQLPKELRDTIEAAKSSTNAPAKPPAAVPRLPGLGGGGLPGLPGGKTLPGLPGGPKGPFGNPFGQKKK